jgi:raffinose/stachyose/melibiose transport system substrate-binding protein
MKISFIKIAAVIITLGLILTLSIGCKTASTQTTAANTTTAETTSAVETTAAAETTSGKPVNLVIWYWGEQECAGLQKWMEESGKLYSKQNPNVSVETVLQTTDGLYPAFRSAAAAKEGPDIQYLWSDIWTLEDAWAGNLEPIDNWWTDKEIKNQLFYDEEYSNGHYWSTKFYLGALVVLYNKQIFKDSGIEVEANKDLTVDDFFGICTKLKDNKITPIACGIKDASVGEWMNAFWGGLKLDNPKEIVLPVLGEKSFNDPKYASFWSMVETMYKDGFFNKDVASLELYQGMDGFKQGKAGMTFVFSSSIAEIQKSLGEENVGILPCIKDVGLASAKYPGGAQSLSITSFSKNKKEAADFLRFLHTSERADALFKETNGAGLMADRSFDTGLVTNPTIKDLLDNYVNASKVTPSVVGYLPAFVHDEGLLKSLQLLLGGQLNADGAIKTMDDKSAEWRNQSPEEVKIFEKLKP